MVALFWKRWLLPRSWPARFVAIIALLCVPWIAWYGWIWWVNASTSTLVKSTGGDVEWAGSGPGDPLAKWRDHPALGTIRVAKFGENKPVPPPELRLLRWQPELRRLELKGSAMGDEHLAQLPPLPKLQSLNLSGSTVSDTGLAMLARREGLTHLGLSGTHVTNAGMVHLSGLTRLRILNLDGTAVGDAGLAALRPLADLKFLTIGERVTDAGIEEIVRHRKLTFLDFKGAPVTDAGMEHLMRELPGLEFLSLRHTKISSAMAGTLEKKGFKVIILPPPDFELRLQELRQNELRLQELQRRGLQRRGLQPDEPPRPVPLPLLPPDSRSSPKAP